MSDKYIMASAVYKTKGTTNLIKIRSLHLLFIFHLLFCSRRVEDYKTTDGK